MYSCVVDLFKMGSLSFHDVVFMKWQSCLNIQESVSWAEEKVINRTVIHENILSEGQEEPKFRIVLKKMLILTLSYSKLNFLTSKNCLVQCNSSSNVFFYSFKNELQNVGGSVCGAPFYFIN